MKKSILSVLLLMFVTAPALARKVSCDCHYVRKGWNCPDDWFYIDEILFEANRSDYKKVGRKVCLKLAKDVILDSCWYKSRIGINNCRFVKKN